MIATRRYTTVAAAALLLAACATGPVRPAWVDGTDAHYKPSQYLLGRGQADTQADAQDRARADLAKVFQVDITVKSEDTLAYEGAAGDAGTTGRTTAAVTRAITTKTDQIIKGIQIAQLWRDPQTHNYYALAVLPRMQAANSLRQEIEARDVATARYIDAARNTDDLLLKIAAAQRALETQIARSAYQKSLKIVDVSGVGIPPQWNAATLRVDLDTLLRRMRIAAAADPVPLPGLQDDLAGGLSAAGFLVDKGKDPDYVLRASLDVTDPEHLEGWYWMRGVLHVQLVNPTTGQVRGSHDWPMKVSARQEAVVRQRLESQVRGVLQHQLRETLIGFAAASDRGD